MTGPGKSIGPLSRVSNTCMQVVLWFNSKPQPQRLRVRNETEENYDKNVAHCEISAILIKSESVPNVGW